MGGFDIRLPVNNISAWLPNESVGGTSCAKARRGSIRNRLKSSGNQWHATCYREGVQSTQHALRLRFSLLASLGLVPLACGGTARGNGGDGGVGAQAHGGADAQGGASATAGAAPMGGKGETKPSCTSPKTDPKTGLVTCSEGHVHRPNVQTCGVQGGGGAPADGGAGGDGNVDPNDLPRVFGSVPCEEDPNVCNAFQYGYCAPQQFGTVCWSGCSTDSDCGQGAICICGNAASPTGGTCQSSSCGSDADCQPGYLCAAYSAGCGGGYACQTPQDRCRVQADCPASEVCTPGEEHWRCTGALICGRPFLVEAQARLAPVREGGAWFNVADAAPRVDHLSPSERAAQAEHWSQLGQMEHASIAAFARFSLQLLSLGAPPELVDACTRALADETAHTRLCFRIASAYAGRALGPGPLDVAGSLALTSLADIVDLVVAEGCFGETSAALQALEAATTASDPAIRAAYSRIAVDEERHAELAFRFVRWALGREPDAVGERLRAVRRQPPHEHALAWNVTLPCLQALLGDNRHQSAEHLVAQ